MRFDYDLTEDEYVEAVLIASAPKTASRRTRGRVVATWLAYAVLFSLTAAGIVLLLIVYGDRARAEDAFRPAALLTPIAQYEWLLPYPLYGGVILTFTTVVRNGLAALRFAIVVLVVASVATGALVTASAFFAEEPGPLDGFGVFRIAPWFVPGTALWQVVAYGWTGRRARRAYAASPYRQATSSVAVDEAGVRNVLPTFETLWRWTAFVGVRRSRRLVLLMTGPSEVGVIVPTRAIGDAAAVAAFVDAVQSRIDPGDRGFAVAPIAVAERA